MIYAITGVMAAGKSTVAECLARRFDRAVHLRGDVFRRMIATGREEMSQTSGAEALRQLTLRYRLAALAAKEYEAAGFVVAVQDNYLGRMLTDFLKMLAPARVHLTVLCPDVETVRAREAAREKTGYVGYTVEQLMEVFTQETPRIGLWLDSSGLTPMETVDAILRAEADGIGYV